MKKPQAMIWDLTSMRQRSLKYDAIMSRDTYLLHDFQRTTVMFLCLDQLWKNDTY